MKAKSSQVISKKDLPPKKPVVIKHVYDPKAPTYVANLPEIVLFTIGLHLPMSAWASLSRSCKSVNAINQKPEFWRAKMLATGIIPETVIDDPFFKNSKPDCRLLTKVLTRSGSMIKDALAQGILPWQVAALAGMETLLDAKYDRKVIDLKDKNGFGVEHYYVMGGHIHLVANWFTAHKPYFKAQSTEDYKLVELAAGAGHPPILHLFGNSYGFDLTRYDEQKERTLLHTAVERGQLKTVTWLIENKVDPTKGRCLPVVATEHDHWNIYDYLLEIKITIKTKRDANALMIYSAKSGKIILMNKLVSVFKIDPKTVKLDRIDLLTAAVIGGQFDTIKHSCAQGWAKIDQRWKLNKSILHIAARKGKIGLIAQLLQEYPTELQFDMTDEVGRTILHYLAMHGDWTLLQKALLPKAPSNDDSRNFTPADLLKPDLHGATIAHHAAECGQLQLLRRLVEHSGKECLHKRDKFQRTPLHLACTSGNTALIRWLVTEQGLSLTAVDCYGRTPVHSLAHQAKKDSRLWKDLVMIVEEFGMDTIIAHRDNQEKTVKDYLQEADQPEVLRVINSFSSQPKIK